VGVARSAITTARPYRSRIDIAGRTPTSAFAADASVAASDFRSFSVRRKAAVRRTTRDVTGRHVVAAAVYLAAVKARETNK